MTDGIASINSQEDLRVHVNSLEYHCLSSQQKTVDYYIAETWNGVVGATDGARLKDKERMLWKMGESFAYRDAIVPQLRVWWADDAHTVVQSWQVTGGEVWFPSTSDGYRRLWEELSCNRIPARELEKMFSEDPELLQRTCREVAQLYKKSIEDVRSENVVNIPALPARSLRKLLTGRWIQNLKRITDMDRVMSGYVVGGSSPVESDAEGES